VRHAGPGALNHGELCAIDYRLTKLADIPAIASVHGPDTILPDGSRFPRFMLLAFTKP
jgi:hypothetical protein